MIRPNLESPAPEADALSIRPTDHLWGLEERTAVPLPSQQGMQLVCQAYAARANTAPWEARTADLEANSLTL